MTKKISYTVGKVCPRHPELGGHRYVSGGCVACTRDRRLRKRSVVAVKAHAKQPLCDEIRQRIEAEVIAERRESMREVRREEQRRRLRRAEDDGRVRR